MKERRRDRSVWIYDPAGFTPQHDWRLALSLHKRGWKTNLISSRDLPSFLSSNPPVPMLLPFYEEFANPLVRYLGRSGRVRKAMKMLFYPRGLVRTFRRIRLAEPGILHVQWSLAPPLDRRFWRVLRRHGWKIVLEVHDPVPLPGNLPGLVGRSQSKLTAVADAIIVHDEWAYRSLRERKAAPERVRIVPLGPPVLMQPADRDESREEIGLARDEGAVLFFGYVKKYKGLEILLRAMAQLRRRHPRSRLLIVGDCQHSTKYYRRLIQRLGLTESTFWIDRYICETEVPKFFAAADVVALPYPRASSSGVALTAFSLGGAVVASATGGLPELIENECSGLLTKPGDVGELGGAIDRLLSNPGLARRLAKEGRRRVEDMHSWQNIARRTEQIYWEVLHE